MKTVLKANINTVFLLSLIRNSFFCICYENDKRKNTRGREIRFYSCCPFSHLREIIYQKVAVHLLDETFN